MSEKVHFRKGHHAVILNLLKNEGKIKNFKAIHFILFKILIVIFKNNYNLIVLINYRTIIFHNFVLQL